MTFFEIDPVVIAVAEDARLFSYLADAPTPPRIVRGRCAPLARRRAGRRLTTSSILDAFSSDAIPIHLLTVEAIDGGGPHARARTA